MVTRFLLFSIIALFSQSLIQANDMSIHRSEQQIADTWDLSPMYASLSEWQKDFDQESTIDYASLFAPYKNAETLRPVQLRELLDLSCDLERRLEKLYTWTHLYHDQDIADDTYKTAYLRVVNRFQTLSEQTSWIEPKILEHTPEQIQGFLQSPELKSYTIILERLVRLKPHTLPSEHENLLALSQRATSTGNQAFSSLNDADFQFADVEDSNGEKHSLTHGTYSVMLRNTDRTLRENAFRTLHNKYKRYENTLAELLNGQIQNHLFHARARKYDSCLEAALFPKNIPPSVYRSLIETVHKNIHVLHRYIEIKKDALKVDYLRPWDLYVPIVPEKKAFYTYEEAVQTVLTACQPLGLEYHDTLKKGLLEKRWVDKYENKNKRSGAYSSGCYDSAPYMLLNYKNLIRDLFTLAHEAGHSMHSELSKTQPYQYSHYPIFVAEVASTFNEELVAQELLHQAKDDTGLKATLINQKLEDIRSTLFRQTMFAEFELFLHECAEQNIPITPKLLNDKYLELNRFYFGEAFEEDPGIASEWARIPHFYYNFYVYQYATGISAAHALADRVLHGGEPERESYLKFLRGGGSLFPIDLLERAGVDMNSGEPVEKTITLFNSLLDELEALLPKIDR